MGVAGYGTAISFGIGPILAGLSFAHLDSYRPMFYGSLAVMAIGIFALKAMGTPENNYMSEQ